MHKQLWLPIFAEKFALTTIHTAISTITNTFKTLSGNYVELRLTPRQLAFATGVSESSIKRWCDSGEIETVRTPGGHRRIPLSGAIQFVRQGEYVLVQPHLLGLPEDVGRGGLKLDDAWQTLASALEAADEDGARRVLFGLYLNRERMSAIGDRVIAPAFSTIGHRWETGEVEVFQERRAFEITRNLLHELRLAQAPLSAAAPAALGGALSGDEYALAPILVELVLRECGWNARYLGTNLPVSSLSAAVERTRPRLAWLSVSHIPDETAFLKSFGQLQATAAESHTALVVGGRALEPPLRRQMAYSAFCETLLHLETFAAQLHPTK
jgi:excisionase family DNA binding protein